MKSYSEKKLDQSTTGTKSQLYIYVDKDTDTIGFGCDWEDDEEGIDSISDIFFQLKHKNLLEQILTVLYKQSVVEERTDVFNEIIKNIYSKILDDKDPDELVVKPTAQGERYV